MTLEEIQEFIQLTGKNIQLFGFTSTSLDKSQATTFAWTNEESGHQKVLFHFKWNCKIAHYYLDAGAYDEEKEILLQDGVIQFVHSVEDVKDENENKMYTLIVLGSYGTQHTPEQIEAYQKENNV